MKPKSLKQKAIEYRKQGYSYGMISEELGLAKSTLSNWLREIPYELNEEAKKRVEKAQNIGQRKHNQKVKRIKKIKKKAKEELGELSQRDLWLLGIGFYLGDGTKSTEGVGIVNSNPKIIKLAVKWFKEVCNVKTENFSLAIHTYPDNKIDETLNFWSELTGIPREQFQKTQVDKRGNKKDKKEGKLPHGTARLMVRARGNKELGVELHRRIMGWIEGCFDQT